jgi:hypothetical protein
MSVVPRTPSERSLSLSSCRAGTKRAPHYLPNSDRWQLRRALASSASLCSSNSSTPVATPMMLMAAAAKLKPISGCSPSAAAGTAIVASSEMSTSRPIPRPRRRAPGPKRGHAVFVGGLRDALAPARRSAPESIPSACRPTAASGSSHGGPGLTPAAMRNSPGMEWDCIVVGGGAAGLSAALVLGRARRRTLLIDAGEQSNLVSSGVGGLLGHDRRAPAELYAIGRRELSAYPSVKIRDGRVVAGQQLDDDQFELEIDDGEHMRGRRVLLATGMKYCPPQLPGLGDLWGKSAFQCPF